MLFRSLLIQGALIYAARNTRGVVIIDASDPRSPRQVGSFADEYPVLQMAAALQGVTLYLPGGATVFYSLAEPQRPVRGAVQVSEREVLRTEDSLRSQQNAQWTGLERIYVKAVPFYIPALTGNVAFKSGFELITKSGFKFGFAIDPLTVGYPLVVHSHFRFDIGYANRSFGVSLGIGTGYPFYLPQFAPTFRFGRYDKLYATFRVAWSLYAIPANAELELVIPVHQRYRVTVELGCGTELPFTCYYSPHALIGMQHFFSGEGMRRTSILTVGAGVAFLGSVVPGPMLSIGFERRF